LPAAVKLTVIKVTTFAVSTAQLSNGLASLQLPTSQRNLPALLREIEGHGASGELRIPEIAQKPVETDTTSLPKKIKASHLRAAFDLVSSFALQWRSKWRGKYCSRRVAGFDSRGSLGHLLVFRSQRFEGATLEAIAVRKPGQEAFKNEEEWGRC
jgi:hypothetical protein